jgi:uncharacterized protein YutE (UPF0331/DUF86 family)
MDTSSFQRLYDDFSKNIDEIKSMTKDDDLLQSPDSIKIVERAKYLFFSFTKTLVDIGHSIILENDFRDPLNRADIFISLAEHGIIVSSVVPGVKKAVLALPKINSSSYAEVLEIISESISDLHKCLDSFAVYFKLKDTKK